MLSWKTVILFWVLIFLGKNGGHSQTCNMTASEEEFELTPADGWYNNLLHPNWGVVDGQLLRRSPTAYSDGVFEPSGPNRPNPFDISDAAHNGTIGRGSERRRNAFMTFFGQQVVEEIMDSQRPGCPREFFNIPIPKTHKYAKELNVPDPEMPFLRSRYDQSTGYSPNNPRQQLNEITPFLDGNLMYGFAKAWTDTLRSFEGGELIANDPNAPLTESIPKINDIRLPMANPPAPKLHMLRPVSRFYRLGNPRGNENPLLLSFGVMWFRYHNYIARKLKAEHSDWSDEQLFNAARKRVIAQHQKVVMYDWLPVFLDVQKDANGTLRKMEMDPYDGYDPHVHPGISQEMQTAALRYGHTHVVAGVRTRTVVPPGQCKERITGVTTADGHKARGIRLCQAYWRSQEILTEENSLNMTEIMRGMVYTLAEREDHIMVPDLRGDLFGPLDFSRRDLAALNIQRGRDHGLPGYNKVREAYNLPAANTWEEINNCTDCNIEELRPIFRNLASLYNSTRPDELDLFTGGLLETTFDGAGPLFKEIMLDQFKRIRKADRFWYENRDNCLFTDEEFNEIQTTTMRNIINITTGIPLKDLPIDVFICDNNTDSGCNCLDPPGMDDFGDTDGTFDECSKLETFDYFESSQVSFALTFVAVGLCIPLTIGVLVLMAKRKERSMATANRRKPETGESDPNKFSAVEWVGPKSGERNIKVHLNRERKKVDVTDRTGRTLRLIDLRYTQKAVHVRLSDDKNLDVMSIRVPGEIDLVLRFTSMGERQKVLGNVEAFFQSISINREKHEFSEITIMKDAETYEDRKVMLDKFFRVVCLQAFKKNARDMNLESLDARDINEIRNVKLTRTEFAEALGLQPNSMFVRNMFLLVDRSRDGFVSFEEFMTMFVTLATGNAEEKANMLFNMYDLKKTGKLSRNQFAKMLKSMMDLADASVEDMKVNQLLETMFEQAGIKGKENMTFEDFKKIFASEEHGEILKKATLGLDVDGGKIDQQVAKVHGSSIADRRKTVVGNFRAHSINRKAKNRQTNIRVGTQKTQPPMTPFAQKMYVFTRYVENYRLQIFWVTLFTLINIGIFIERAHFYSIEREHAGLRRLAGYGVSVTRGAASTQMFTYAFLLVTMSRNTLTFFRETFLHRFIPFDSFHAFHKYVAGIALVSTVMHVVGHAINLYHISTQASSDLNCYFREYFRATHILASFHYWAFSTITGLTGIILTIIVIIMFVFATEYARRHVFNAFWFTHSFYILLYIFLTMHGAGRLVQDPIWGWFFIGPVVIFIIDKLVSLSRNRVEIPVTKAEILPSGVTNLVFKRPLNFDYKSGQWVRIACLDLGKSEYHPFTLTSAPHEETLSLHIRAVGPWTNNIRRVYDPNNSSTVPKLLVDGPFGEGHQDWYRFPVAVLVGGGIGVTPFASILKDLVSKSRMKVKFPCQKVYFLWVTRTQKSFEWMTDIIRQVEGADTNDLVAVHIFITQFQQKFDLRTTMLYICERHFQRIAGQSLFTGLRATTHFGRPKFEDFLASLAHEHETAQSIGVFSCGPPPMTLNVESACSSLNKLDGPTYVHHYENF
ncbi:dual oxidase 1-like [Haliotis cracherodii]|uniref:dual oxidase 1-like n=1 Tax=Haliotis cracherodii TaxID=6455 RepID=UPI0039E9C3C9